MDASGELTTPRTFRDDGFRGYCLHKFSCAVGLRRVNVWPVMDDYCFYVKFFIYICID